MKRVWEFGIEVGSADCDLSYFYPKGYSQRFGLVWEGGSWTWKDGFKPSTLPLHHSSQRRKPCQENALALLQLSTRLRSCSASFRSKSFWDISPCSSLLLAPNRTVMCSPGTQKPDATYASAKMPYLYPDCIQILVSYKTRERSKWQLF